MYVTTSELYQLLMVIIGLVNLVVFICHLINNKKK